MTADSGADTPLRSSSSVGSGRGSAVLVAWSAMAVPLLVLGGVVAALVPRLAWWAGVAIGLVAAAALVLLRLRGAAGRLLRAIDAVPADASEHTRFFNLVQGLSLAGGIPQPELHLVVDDARNAAAVAKHDRAAIVLTTGLLDNIDRIALEGIVAEALVRIGNRDAEAATTGVALFGPFLSGSLSPFGRPVGRFGLRRLLGTDRDLVADRAAVALTRYPPGLLAGLDLIRAGSPALARSSAATDHIWLVSPADGDGDDVIVTSAPLDLRIDVLAEL